MSTRTRPAVAGVYVAATVIVVALGIWLKWNPAVLVVFVLAEAGSWTGWWYGAKKRLELGQSVVTKGQRGSGSIEGGGQS